MNRPEGNPSPGSAGGLATLSRRTGEGLGVRGGSWPALMASGLPRTGTMNRGQGRRADIPVRSDARTSLGGGGSLRAGKPARRTTAGSWGVWMAIELSRLGPMNRRQRRTSNAQRRTPKWARSEFGVRSSMLGVRRCERFMCSGKASATPVNRAADVFPAGPRPGAPRRCRRISLADPIPGGGR